MVTYNEAHADFAVKLLRETTFGESPDMSIIISPVSIAIALSMVGNENRVLVKR